MKRRLVAGTIWTNNLFELITRVIVVNIEGFITKLNRYNPFYCCSFR